MTAITLNLGDDARTLIEGWVRDGHYASIEEVVEAGIHFVREQVEANRWQLSDEDMVAVEEGLADIDAGRTYSLEETRAHFNQRFASGK